MRRMGGACSMQRNNFVPRERQHGRETTRGIRHTLRLDGRRLSRHSVLGALPDDSISHLFPVSDNYSLEDDGNRSPKSLAELSAETLCRSIAYIDGELPAGLPQDVVDLIVGALVKKNALNATTLRVLKNCELGMLSLAGCREVTDEWMESLTSKPREASRSDSAYYSTSGYDDNMDLDLSRSKSEELYDDIEDGPSGDSENVADESSCSTSSFVSASSGTGMAAAATSHDHMMATDMDKMDDSHHIVNDTNLEVSTFGMSTTSSLTLLDLRGSQRLTDKGLIKLSDLSNLEVARLDNCFSIIGRGMLAFSTSRRLLTLSLANCRRLTDEAIVNISHLFSIEALCLSGCRCLTDRSLAAIADLMRLRRLDLSQCDLISDSGLTKLEHIDGLEELSLGWCRLISDAGVDILSKQGGRPQNLRTLSLARCNLTDQGVQFLSRLGALEELDFNGCTEISSAALGITLGKLPRLSSLDVSYCPGILLTSWQGRIDNLKRLDLNYSRVQDSHLRRWTELPALEELNLDSCLAGDAAISHLASNNVLPNLASLDLADSDVTDLGMVHIAQFRNLKRLSLFYCSISNGGLRHISKLACLEVLNLDSREIGDEGLWHLRNLRQLKSLDIFSGRITDVGCSHIAKIKSLESLELCGGGVTDFGCTMLATLHNLTSLNLSQNERITNRGAVTLAALSSLRALNLSNTRVNGAALGYFSDLLNLQSLSVYGCRGMEDSRGLDRLQSGLPGLKCVRLNSRGSANDGMIRLPDEETDDESYTSDDEDVYSNFSHVATHDDDEGDRSEMDEDTGSENDESSEGDSRSEDYSE